MWAETGGDGVERVEFISYAAISAASPPVSVPESIWRLTRDAEFTHLSSMPEIAVVAAKQCVWGSRDTRHLEWLIWNLVTPCVWAFTGQVEIVTIVHMCMTAAKWRGNQLAEQCGYGSIREQPGTCGHFPPGKAEPTDLESRTSRGLKVR